MPNPPQKILVMRLRGIGDVILSLPVLENLRAAYPYARIDYLTEPPSAPLLQAHPVIHRVHVLEHKRWQKLPLLAALFANWDFIHICAESNMISSSISSATRARRCSHISRARRCVWAFVFACGAWLIIAWSSRAERTCTRWSSILMCSMR